MPGKCLIFAVSLNAETIEESLPLPFDADWIMNMRSPKSLIVKEASLSFIESLHAIPGAHCDLEPADAAFSLSSLGSLGGEGWGEQAVFSHFRSRFMESLNVFFDGHSDHEPSLLCNDGGRDLPLPEGEGWGEGERGVRIVNRVRPNQRFMERQNNQKPFIAPFPGPA